jgi:hypothetical protein
LNSAEKNKRQKHLSEISGVVSAGQFIAFEKIMMQAKSCAPSGRESWKLLDSSGFTTGLCASSALGCIIN